MAAPPPASSPRPRPVYRNIDITDLARYRLPLPGIVSILHRISGALLFLFIWLLLWLLQASVTDASRFQSLYGHPLVKIVVFVLLWSVIYHLCAGIRYLIIDVSHRSADLQPARQSSAIVLLVSIVLTLIIGVKLW